MPTINTPQGQVTVRGPMKLENPDELDSALIIEAPDTDQPLNDWLADSDSLADRILDMFSLAEGRLVNRSVRRLDAAGKLILSDCDGDQHASPACDPIFPSRDLQPLLKLAVSSYTQDLRDRTGFDVALRWFIHRPYYTELRLVAAMNALEHLLTIFERTNAATVAVGATFIDPFHFNLLLTHMLTHWDRFAAGVSSAEKAGFRDLKAKIITANRRGSRDKLENRLRTMLETYKVPLGGLAWSRIQSALNARNSVVHEGVYEGKEDEPLRGHVRVIRELLKRLFLTLLRYKGQYMTLLDGRDYVPFPPS